MDIVPRLSLHSLYLLDTAALSQKQLVYTEDQQELLTFPFPH